MTVILKTDVARKRRMLAVVPQAIANPPGLSAIRYRIGTFSSFRQAMLDAIALPDLLATSVTTLANPVAPGDTAAHGRRLQRFSSFRAISRSRLAVSICR